MLRRRTASSSQLLQLSLLTASATHPCVSSAALCGPARAFFDNLKKQFGAVSGNNSANVNGSSANDKSGSQVPPGFPPGFNTEQMRTLRQLFDSQPKEKQEQLVKQALKMQKMMSNVPGVGKFAQKHAAIMEQMLKMQHDAEGTPTSSTTAAEVGTSNGSQIPASSSTSSAVPPRRDLFCDAVNKSANKVRSGPSLDELRRVNLGPEIEALFEELQTIRSRKNEYRDKYSAAQAALDGLRKEHDDLVAREANLRNKLVKAEQDVMLLTSENMELRDTSKAVKQLTHTNKQLAHEVEQLKSEALASAAPGTASYAALKQQHQAAEDALCSLRRKVGRMRRQDPLLQFSVACNDVSRLCGPIRAGASVVGGSGSSSRNATGAMNSESEKVMETSQEAPEQAFADLQSRYHARQHEAWLSAARDHGAAARAYVAVVRRYVMTRVPHANFDAVVAFTGDAAALNDVFTAAGFTVQAIPGELNRIHVVATAEAKPFTDKPGPYGYAFALRIATAGGSNLSSSRQSSSKFVFTVTTAHPFVSATLVHNAKRSVVHYDTARASGPGGQATNVTETQVYAKLIIDGVPAFTAEAQDSRSALTNKEAALEKLRQQRRQQYNDTLAKQEKAESVQAQLIEAMRNQGGFTIEEDVITLVQEAAASQEIAPCDAALVAMLQELSCNAASSH